MKQTMYWSFLHEKTREVDDRYALKQSTGHNFESSANRVKKASTVSSGRVVLVATVKVKTIGLLRGVYNGASPGLTMMRSVLAK